MKKLTTILMIIGVFAMTPNLLLAESDIIKYVDDQGKTHLVDDIAKVPNRYRAQVDYFDFSSEKESEAIEEDESIATEVSAYEGPSVVGKILNDGKLLSTVTDNTPSFTIRNQNTAELVEADIEYSEGEYKILSLEPGSYRVSVKSDVGTQLISDDLVGARSIVVSGDTATNADLRVSRLIQLEKGPARKASSNANQVLNSRCKDKLSFQGPLQFNWSAMGTDTTYKYSVQKASCSPQVLGDVVASGSTNASSVEVSLQESGPNEFYYISIEGRNAASALNDGFWEFRFRIDQAYGKETSGITLTSSK